MAPNLEARRRLRNATGAEFAEVLDIGARFGYECPVRSIPDPPLGYTRTWVRMSS